MARRILIVDEATTNRIVLKAKLSAAGYAVDLAKSLRGAKMVIAENIPDVVILSAGLSADDRESFVQLLGSRSTFGRVPILILARKEDRLLPNAHIDGVIRTPLQDTLLLARLRSVLRIRDLEEELASRAQTCREMGLAEPPADFVPTTNVALYGSPRTPSADLALDLSGPGLTLTNLGEGGQFGRHLKKDNPMDVVVLNLTESGTGSDMATISDLRCRKETRDSAIIVILSESRMTDAAIALDLGASDVILEPLAPGFLAATIHAMMARRRRIDALRHWVTNGLKLAVKDPLTDLYNRRYAQTHLDRLVKRATGTGRPLAVLMTDIDRFKRINDKYGHNNGDLALKSVAKTLKSSLRGADMIARFGGEEFLIVLSDSSLNEAKQIADRLRQDVQETKVLLDTGERITITMSIGLSVMDPTEPKVVTGKSLVRDADQALYRSKAEGRNQVTIYQKAA